jgi:hypothetical protein
VTASIDNSKNLIFSDVSLSDKVEYVLTNGKISIRYDFRMNHNNLKSNKLRRGRPEEPLEVEIEFIQSEEGTRRWVEIVRLLEH